MAGESQLTDFSLDPFQVQEDALREQLKNAYARSLRQNYAQIPVGDVSARFRANWDANQAQAEIPKLNRQREALSNQFQESLVAALKNEDPQLQEMARNPATRGIALEAVKQRQKQRMDQQEMDALRNGFQGGPGGALPQSVGANEYQMAMVMAQSSNPTIAARGKILLDQLKPQDPTHSVMRDSQGNYVPIQGADAAVGSRQRAIEGAKAEGDLVDFPWQGGTIKIPRSDALILSRYSSANSPATPPNGQPAIPVAPPAPGPVPGPNSAVSGLPPGAPSGPVAAPNMPQVDPALAQQYAAVEKQYGIPPGTLTMIQGLERSGDNAVSPAGARGRLQVMPQNFHYGDPTNPNENAWQSANVIQEQMRILQSKGIPITPENLAAAYNGGPAVAAGQRPMRQETQDYVQRAGPLARALAAANPVGSAQASGPQLAGEPLRQPTFAPGVSNPTAVDTYKKQVEEQNKAYDEYRKAAGDPRALERTTKKLAELNQRDMPEGYPGMAAQAWDRTIGALTGNRSQPVADAEEFAKTANAMLGPIVKQYGYNPSNVDMRVAQEQIPTMMQSRQGRQQIIDAIAETSRYNAGLDSLMTQGQRQGFSPAQVKDNYDQWWYGKGGGLEQFQKEKGAGNPTQAGSAQQSALPATSAAQRGKEPSITGFLSDPQSWKDMGRNAITAPNNILTGGQALWDQWKKPGYALAQAAGMNPDWASEKAAIEQRMKDPRYQQASAFYNVFNPTSLIGGTATTIPKLAAAGGVQGFLEPTDKEGQRLGNVGQGTVLGGALGALAKLIPSTEVKDIAGTVGRDAGLAEKFGINATSAQANPESIGSRIMTGLGVNAARAEDQAAAITKNLLKDAGLPAQRVTPEVLADGQKALGAEFNKVLPDTVKIKIGGQYKPMLDKVLAIPGAEEIMAKSGPLSAVKTLIEGNPGAIKASDLHEAWKGLSSIAGDNSQAAGAIRNMLGGLIENGLGTEAKATFKELNRKWGAIEDIARIYKSGAGEGSLTQAGVLSPSKLVLEAGRGPVQNAATDQAAQAVQRFGIRNPGYEITGEPTKSGIVSSIRDNVVGPALSALDVSAVNASPAVKKMLEMLRAGTVRGPMAF